MVSLITLSIFSLGIFCHFFELFILEKGKLPTGTRENVKKVKFIKPLPEHSQVVNYVLPPDYDFPDGYEPLELSDEQIESIKRLNQRN